MGISDSYLQAFYALKFAIFWFVDRRWFVRFSIVFGHNFLTWAIPAETAGNGKDNV